MLVTHSVADGMITDDFNVKKNTSTFFCKAFLGMPLRFLRSNGSFQDSDIN